MSKTTNGYIKLKGYPKVSFHNNRGVDLCKSGEFDQGIAEFNQAIRIAPLEWVPYHNRANAFQSIDFTVCSIADFAIS